jgi:hypothetical protein
MEFKKYLGKPLVLITNSTDSEKSLNDVQLPGITFLVASDTFKKVPTLGKEYCVARNLTQEDIEDEDFFTYLKNMWADDQKVDKYLTSYTVEDTRTNRAIN